MSVESAIATISSTLRSVASTAQDRAFSLIEQAPFGIAGLEPWKIGRADYKVSRPGGSVLDPPTFGVDGPKPLDVPAPPALASHPLPFARFTVAPPSAVTLTPRAPTKIKWRTLPGAHPALTPPRVNPVAPVLTPPDSPTLRAPTAVPVNTIELPDPPGVDRPPDPAVFSHTPLDLYREGLALAQGPLGGLSAWLESVRGHSKAARSALLASLQAVLSGAPVLPESWEPAKSGVDRITIEAERRTQLEGLDLQAGEQTGMPTGARIAQKLEVELAALRAFLMAAAQSATERQALQIRALQQAIDTAGRMADLSLTLRGKEADWLLSAWDSILDGADAAADVIKQLAAWEKQRQEWTTQYNRLQVRRLTRLIEREKAKLRRLSIELGNDAPIIAYNQSLAKAQEVAKAFTESRIALFSEQVDWLGEDEQWRLLAWKGYEYDIQRYQILVRRGTAERRLLQARLEQDQLTIQAEEQKISSYNAQLDALSAETAQISAHTQHIASQNRAKIDAFQVQVEAQTDMARSLNQEMKRAVATLLKMANADSSAQEINIRRQEIADRHALHAASIKLSEKHTELVATLKTHARLIQQQLARGKTQMHGAKVLGGIATEATSGFNALGTTIAEENA